MTMICHPIKCSLIAGPSFRQYAIIISHYKLITFKRHYVKRKSFIETTFVQTNFNKACLGIILITRVRDKKCYKKVE